MNHTNIPCIKNSILIIVTSLISFITYIVLSVSPAFAFIEAYRQKHDKIRSENEAWHEPFAFEKGGDVARQNDASRSFFNNVLRDNSQRYAARSMQYDATSELTTKSDKSKLKILIPLYIYPDLHQDDSFWKAVAEAQSHVDITAIINPHNGPLHDISDPRYKDYQKGLQALRDAKVTILGYSPTNYTKREKHKIQADIDTYVQHYDIDGIFFDEAANTAEHKNFYAQLATYIRTKTNLKLIMLNPGVATAPAYVDAQHSIADTVVTFEQTYAHWTQVPGPPPWTQTLTASRFALLVHTAPNITAMKRAIDLGASHHYGYIYITDDMGANPWDTLPSYWQDMVRYIQQLNAIRSTRP